MQSQLESGLHLLRDEYRSVGKHDDAAAVTELMQKLKKVRACRESSSPARPISPRSGAIGVRREFANRIPAFD